MALGGGTWTTQNKILPGTYVNFSSLTRASATLSDRGIAAAPFILSWGPENEVFAVASGEFQKNSKTIFGYAYDHPKLWALREIFLHATTVYCYRLGGGGAKAANDYASAKYSGVRGNDLTITVAPNVDDETLWDVSTWLDGTVVDTQTAAAASELTGNDYVDFKGTAELAATAGMPLTGGIDPNVTGDSHQAFLDKIEPYAYHVLCCPSAEPAIVKLYAAFTRRMRDEVGAKFQLVAWEPSTTDYEGVIGVWNQASHPSAEGVDKHAVVYWTAGAQAGAAVNKSLTNTAYDGELVLDTGYTQAELEAAIQAGRFLFHSVSGETRVLEDINTLVTLTPEKGEAFQSNQTMRVCDQIANDIAVLFNTQYVGKVPNNDSGRMSLWNDIVKLIRELETIQAVENFDSDSVACELGNTKKSVVCTIQGLNVINAMSQLYMSVVIQ